jgi:hypothetical protein
VCQPASITETIPPKPVLPTHQHPVYPQRPRGFGGRFLPATRKAKIVYASNLIEISAGTGALRAGRMAPVLLF